MARSQIIKKLIRIPTNAVKEWGAGVIFINMIAVKKEKI